MVPAYLIVIHRRIGAPLSVVMVSRQRAIQTVANWQLNANVVSITMQPCQVDSQGRLAQEDRKTA